MPFMDLELLFSCVGLKLRLQCVKVIKCTIKINMHNIFKSFTKSQILLNSHLVLKSKEQIFISTGMQNVCYFHYCTFIFLFSLLICEIDWKAFTLVFIYEFQIYGKLFKYSAN